MSDDPISPGTRDRLVMCGQMAIGALGLDGHHDSPLEVAAEIDRLTTELAKVQADYQKYVDGVDHAMTKEVERLQGEEKRLLHIIGVLRYHCEGTGEASKEIMDNVRIKDGWVEVWCLGEWADVENAEAEFKEITKGEPE